MKTASLGAAERAAVEAVTAKDRSNLYLTSQFLQDPARYDAFLAMYAMMRIIDDTVDNVLDKDLFDAEQRQQLLDLLDRYEQRIRACYQGEPCSEEPLDRALTWALALFPVPLQLWLDFVDAMRFDVEHPRFADFAAFLRYAQGATVAPTVIYVYLLTSTRGADACYRVQDFDYLRCGRELGIFAYLAHILRDVAEDALVGSRGLVYLSIEDLQSCGLRDQDLREFAQRAQGDARFTELVALISARAQSYAVHGEALVRQVLPRLSADCRFVLQLIVVYYRELLQRVSAPNTDLFAPTSLLDNQAKLEIALRVAAECGFELRPERLAQVMGRPK